MKLNQKNCHVANVSLAKSSLVIHSFGNISSRINDKYVSINCSSGEMDGEPIVRNWLIKEFKG